MTAPVPPLPLVVHARLVEDERRFAESGLPPDVEAYLLDAYGVDVRGRYAGFGIKNPWGLASGQLSMKPGQVEGAARAGLGFTVLKTVIAQDASGDRTMGEWAVKESRMVVEPVVGRLSGRSGWTVTWKGRGWWQSFDDYLALVRESAAMGRAHRMLVAPSVKYHLPTTPGGDWKREEYEFTTRALLTAFRDGVGPATAPMPLEKDFSPTLAGSDRSKNRQVILEWLDAVPPLIRGSVGRENVRVGIKLFNAVEDDAFQVAMLAQVHGADPPDFAVYANRLFDPDREFDGKRGVAYGGPDLSERNLGTLRAFRRAQRDGTAPAARVELSATGDVHSGRVAVAYALLGCSSFQMHTLFQLPAGEFTMTHGDRTERALHRLYFDPDEGLVAWMLRVGQALGLSDGGVVRLLDLAGAGSDFEINPLDVNA